MTELESALYQEMIRTIKLLGGKDDLLNILETMNDDMPRPGTVKHTYNLIKCWNDSVERALQFIPENMVYQKVDENPCGYSDLTWSKYFKDKK